MTQTNTHYDHVAWRQTQPRGWEPLDNPIVPAQPMRALPPLKSLPDAIAVGAQGRQEDNAETIARGIVVQAIPVIALSLPLAILIMALVWMSGVVSVNFLGFCVGVFGLWATFSLFCYNQLARRSHTHSYYGVELAKVHSLTTLKQQELRQDFELKRLALNAYLNQIRSSAHDG
ncbi:MAG: hypothetical protein KDE53_07750 [Caldilineaceae bacterium]|nr:hypothetical protein [Caldilineaceae bacterium]